MSKYFSFKKKKPTLRCVLLRAHTLLRILMTYRRNSVCYQDFSHANQLRTSEMKHGVCVDVCVCGRLENSLYLTSALLNIVLFPLSWTYTAKLKRKKNYLRITMHPAPSFLPPHSLFFFLYLVNFPSMEKSKDVCVCACGLHVLPVLGGSWRLHPELGSCRGS